MEDDEIRRFAMHLLRTADPDYLMPPAEFLGKFMVCKHHSVVAVFDTKEEAMQEAAKHEAGSIEIRQPLPSEDGTRTKVIIPGVIRRIGSD